MRTTRFALLAALFAGCGGSSADPQEVAEDLAGALCDLSFRCCTTGEVHYILGPYVTQEDCAARLVNSANLNTSLSFSLDLFEEGGVFLPNLAALDEAVEDGRTEVDRDQVDACIEHLQQIECNALEEEPTMCIPPERDVEDPCDPLLMFDGKQSEGERCSSVGFSFECERGLACRAISVLGTDGACVAPGEVGDYCFTDQECGIDLYCSQLDGTCQLLGQPGDVCAYADPDDPAPDDATLLLRCDEGLSCDPVTDLCVAPCERGASCTDDIDCDEAAGLLCILGRCDTLRGEGLPCADDLHCEPGLICRVSLAEGGVFVCSQPLAVGEFCSVDPDCASGYCAPDLRCAPSFDPGEPCPVYDHAQCKNGYCSDTITTDSLPFCDQQADCPASSCDLVRHECVPVCVQRKADGQACGCDGFGVCNDFECLSNECVNGTCRTLPLENGQECDSPEQCESEFCGHDGLCDMLPLPDGKLCFYPEECESRVCSEGICTPGLQAGSECTPGLVDCAADLFCDPEERPPICVPVLDTGEVCKTSEECRGSCVLRLGRMVCDPTPPVNGAICDGGDVATEGG
jgi:hypothetical protein